MSATETQFEAGWLAAILREPCGRCGAEPGQDCDAPEFAALELQRRRQHALRAAAGTRAYQRELGW